MTDDIDQPQQPQDDDDRRRFPPPFGGTAGVGGTAALGGAGGLSVGGVGAAALSGEAAVAATTGPGSAAAAGPVGVPVGSSVAMGPSGLPTGQGAAIGPTGVPVGPTGGIGPDGLPLVPGDPGTASMPTRSVGRIGSTVKRHPGAFIAGAIAAVVLIGGTTLVLAASDDETPSLRAAPVVTDVATTDATLTPAAATAVEPDTTVADTVRPVPTTTTQPASTTTALALSAAAVCMAGTWVADNQTFANALLDAAALGGSDLTVQEVTGQVRVEITGAGSVTTTFEDWTIVLDIGGAGVATLGVVGTESSTVTFGNDGAFTVEDLRIDSHMTVVAVGTALFDGPSPEGVFHGPGSFTCEGDVMHIITPGADLSDENFTRVG